MNRRRRHVVVLGLLVIAAAGVVLLRLLIDRDPHAGTVALRWPAADYASFRVTATLVGAIVGASLATAGVMLQALLRNVLASPFILGVSSGAGLGYMIAAYVGYGVHAAVNADVPATPNGRRTVALTP